MTKALNISNLITNIECSKMNVEDIFKKINEFSLSTLSESKPQYIFAIENELLNQKLSDCEYIKVPFKQFKEQFSLITIYNFLSHKILKKYENDLIIDEKTVPRAFDESINAIYFYNYKGDSELLAIHINGKPYIYILRTKHYDYDLDYYNFDTFIKDMRNWLEQAIIDALNITSEEKGLISLHNKNGSTFILIPRLGYRSEDLNRAALMTTNSKWLSKIITVNLLNSKSYQLPIYFKKTGNYALIYIDAQEIENLLDFAITSIFREKIILL